MKTARLRDLAVACYRQTSEVSENLGGRWVLAADVHRHDDGRELLGADADWA